MSKCAQWASNDRAMCDEPIKHFLAFAKGLVAKSSEAAAEAGSGPDAGSMDA